MLSDLPFASHFAYSPRGSSEAAVQSRRIRDLLKQNRRVGVPPVAAANRVYLSPQARAILDELRPATGDTDWVLESPRKPGTHLTTVRTARLSILDRDDMRPWTPHDLRRTTASKMRAMGVSRLVVQGILNHKDRSVTAVYDRYGADPEKQRALTEWGRRVEEIAGGEPKARVVEFPMRVGAAG